MENLASYKKNIYKVFLNKTKTFTCPFLSGCLLYVLLQDFVSDVHYFVVKEYISQLIKNNYSCKNRKNEKAAAKLEEQWGELCDLFQEMVQ